MILSNPVVGETGVHFHENTKSPFISSSVDIIRRADLVRGSLLGSKKIRKENGSFRDQFLKSAFSLKDLVDQNIYPVSYWRRY